MTARMEAVESMKTIDEFPLEFPFISVIVTGKHTEIVLTRGVGLHTIMAFNVDIGAGTLLDRISKDIIEICKKELGLDFSEDEKSNTSQPTAE